MFLKTSRLLCVVAVLCSSLHVQAATERKTREQIAAENSREMTRERAAKIAQNRIGGTVRDVDWKLGFDGYKVEVERGCRLYDVWVNSNGRVVNMTSVGICE